MARINAIQQIDKYIDLKVQDYDDEKILGSLLNILYDIYIEDREVKDFGSKSIKKSILSILGDDENHNIDNIDFILSMSEYIVKLRQYKINKKVYDKNSDPRYLINLNEGDTYNDPIFNQIKIISKNFNNNIDTFKKVAKESIYLSSTKRINTIGVITDTDTEKSVITSINLYVDVNRMVRNKEASTTLFTNFVLRKGLLYEIDNHYEEVNYEL